MTTFRRALAAAAVAAGAAAPHAARAQGLGPFRQFLSVEPYYVHTLYDDGGGDGGRRYTDLNSVGGRLWINYAPFVRNRVLAKGGIALFGQTSLKRNDGYRVTHYGAELEQFFTNRPYGGVFDPLISVGAGAYTARRPVAAASIAQIGGTAASTTSLRTTRFALTPGVGFRIPVPNRFQLRFDARDAIVFNQLMRDGGEKTGNNFEFVGALGITF